MSTQMIKIQSSQGFTEKAVPGTFIRKLVDFIIPGSGNYDLSKSYINLNVELENLLPLNANADFNADPGKYSGAFNADVAFGNQVVPTSTLVRNCQMFSSKHGMVESIRRNDTLRNLLYSLENSQTSQTLDLNHLGPVAVERGMGVKSSSVREIVKTNVDNAGQTDLDHISKARSRDIQIPIGDLFGVGNSIWNGDNYGDTRIHCELNMNNLTINRCGGHEDVNTSPEYKFWDVPPNPIVGGEYIGIMQDQTVGYPLNTEFDTLITMVRYADFGQQAPWYVGQAINIDIGQEIQAGVQTNNTIINHVIKSVEYSNPPPAVNGEFPATSGTYMRATIKTVTPYFSNTNAIMVPNTDGVFAVEIRSQDYDHAVAEILVNRAEIVLVQTDEPGQFPIDYRTYSTEMVQGNSLTAYNNQFIIEPNCQNLIVATCDSGLINPTRPWNNYQISINNVNQTGNRQVWYNQNLHQDRMLRFFNNRGQTIGSLRNEAVGGSGTVDQYAILETMPLTQSSKNVDLEINSAGIEDIILYKELVRTI